MRDIFLALVILLTVAAATTPAAVGTWAAQVRTGYLAEIAR